LCRCAAPIVKKALAGYVRCLSLVTDIQHCIFELQSEIMSHRRKIFFIVPAEVHVLDLTGPVQVFYEANGYGAEYDLKYIGFDERLVSAAGLPFGQINHYSTVEPHPGDYIFVPGADMEYLRSESFKSQHAFLSWLRKISGQHVTLCSVCTGAFILAEAGLLDNIRCTTHWKRLEELQLRYPDVLAEENILYTQAGHIYTSAGITSGIDLSLAIIEEHYGPMFTHKVARELLVYHRRSPDHTQKSIYLDYRNHLHPGVHRVQDWLVENLDKKVKIADLAEQVNMSERNLTRAFKNATGVTINLFMKELRLEKAATLRNNPEFGMEAIAAQVGYTNARQLRRITKKGQ
jgi:transcriptional regulator GlxA family with amidase domain